MSTRAIKGQPLEIRATDWNQMLDLIEPKGSPTGKRPPLAAGLIRLHNTSGVDMEIYGACCYEFANSGITAPTDPNDLPELVYQWADPAARPATDARPAVCILQEPITAGAVGLARVEGETWAKVRFESTAARQGGLGATYPYLVSDALPCAQLLGPFPTSTGECYTRAILHRRPLIRQPVVVTAGGLASDSGLTYFGAGWSSYLLQSYSLSGNGGSGVEVGSGYFRVRGNRWQMRLQARLEVSTISGPRIFAVALMSVDSTPTMVKYSKTSVNASFWGETTTLTAELMPGVKYAIYQFGTPQAIDEAVMTLEPVDSSQRLDLAW